MKTYDSWLSGLLNKFTRNYTREEIAASFNLSGKSCLDIACGDGDLINNYLSGRYIEATGIDISPKLIKQAKLRKANNAFFKVGDIDQFVDQMVIQGKKYNDIYLLAILEHIQWPTIFIKKLTKILDKQGRIIIEVPNSVWLPHRLSMVLGKFPVTAPTVGVIPGVFDEHIRFFTHKTLNKIMKDTGFKLLKTDCSGKFRFIKKLYPSLFSPDIVAVYEK